MEGVARQFAIRDYDPGMLPELITDIPGPRSVSLAADLKKYECRNVTYVDEEWPVFWQRAEGVNVWDADGNRFLDLTSAFGVAGLGHGWAQWAMRGQAAELLHGMGDVHPTELKVELCRELSRCTYERWGAGVGKTTLSNSGFEAVETALKTAHLATGRSGVVTFRNGYHGLGYGALLGGGFEPFREPFSGQLADVRHVLDFPRDGDGLEKLVDQLDGLDAEMVSAVLVEPIQGRGGKVVPQDGFLAVLREWCDRSGAVLIFDEIYSGFNRTGKMFACEYEEVVPDLLCVGKALSGGYPISACIGKVEVMDAWPESPGEALHTSTFLGNPVGCAMALASLKEHTKPETAAKVGERGDRLRGLLENVKSDRVVEVRGRGLMLGVELDVNGAAVLMETLRAGVIMLADGPEGNVLAFTPPFDLSDEEMGFAVGQVERALDRLPKG